MKIIKHLSERNFLFLAIIWALFITVLSLISFNSFPKEYVSGNDKIIHFLFYAVFVLLLCLAKRKSHLKMKHNLLIVVFAILYGTVIEVLQGAVTKNREADFHDALANSLGAIVGFICFYCLKNKIFNKYF